MKIMNWSEFQVQPEIDWEKIQIAEKAKQWAARLSEELGLQIEGEVVRMKKPNEEERCEAMFILHSRGSRISGFEARQSYEDLKSLILRTWEHQYSLKGKLKRLRSKICFVNRGLGIYSIGSGRLSLSLFHNPPYSVRNHSRAIKLGNWYLKVGR